MSRNEPFGERKASMNSARKSQVKNMDLELISSTLKDANKKESIADASEFKMQEQVGNP